MLYRSVKFEAVEWRPTGFLRMHRILEEVHAGREMNERLWQRAVV